LVLKGLAMEEGLLVLAAVVALGIPIAVIALIISVSGLRRRLAALEQEIARLRRAPAAKAAAARDVQVAQEIVPASVEAPAPDVAASGPKPPPLTPAPPSPAKDGPLVMNAARVSALGDWLRDNWVYAVSALSLALAGIFFVQYGVEKGLLPPALRVTMAILFGMALVVAGEWIRRRSGDGAGVATAYLPSTFSGAGIVSMFAGVIAARQLYGLIGVEMAFAGLCSVAALAVLLGWFYGPFLAAVGLVGAAVAPFVVGGSSDAPYWLYGYFALITAVGLAVDAQRRWAWVSVLALALGYGGGALVLVGSGGEGWFALFVAGLAVMAVLLPARGLAPDHSGPLLVEALFARENRAWPIFPTRLAASSIGLSVLALTGLQGAGSADSLMAFFCLAGLAVALVLWSRTAPALADLAALPVAGFLVRLGLEGLELWPLARAFSDQAIALRAPETAAPGTVSLVLGLAVVMSVVAAWRSRMGAYRAFWMAGAALAAPLAVVVLELTWDPSRAIGAYPWALQVIALAALMAVLAQRFAAQEGAAQDGAAKKDAGHQGFAYAALSCLSLIALALFLVTTKGALTLALGALVVAAAALDRRFRLPEMGWFIQAGIIALSWRLVIDPGLEWAVEDAALWEVVASYGGAAMAAAAGLYILKGIERRSAKVFLESAFVAYAALFANVLITRWLVSEGNEQQFFSHWGVTLNALPWLILMLTQLYRLQLGGALRVVRWALASVAAVIGFGGLGLAVTLANPLFGLQGRESEVLGPLVLDTMFVAYALPALLLLAAWRWMGHLAAWLRHGLLALGAGLAALYAGLEIRRFWRGDDLSLHGVTQPELYSYTVALMVLGAALLYQAIARRSPMLRRAGMAVIALTVAKVFLIDASGLSGLTRVFSFLALGLSLAGLAWLNRWAAGQQDDRSGKNAP
jgi:uncharacterized membrane protein